MLAIALLFIGRHPDRLSAPFGPSHDGFNAALYMTGARALVEDGPLASRFGASARTVSGDRVVYAHHPPLVYLEDAAALVALGPTEAAARLPAVVSSLLALLLLGFFLPACGLRSGPSAFGLLFAFATPMFMMFGATTEPHALGLAPMTALLVLWHRERSGSDVPRWALASVAALATFTSWQAALFAMIVAAALLLVDRRRSAAAAAFAGTLIAVTLIALWILWAYDGDAANFVNRAIHRLGVGGLGRVTFRQVARQQMLYFADLFPVGGWLVVPIAACGLLDARTRPFVAVSLGTVLGYALLFKNGAYDHNYWLYCILLPLTLGAAAAADRMTQAFARIALPEPPLVISTALLVALGIAVWKPSGEETQRRWAAEIGAQARALEWPPGQRYAYHMFGDRGPTDLLPWLLYYARREPYGVEGLQTVPHDEIVLQSIDRRLVPIHGEQALQAAMKRKAPAVRSPSKPRDGRGATR